MCASVVTEEGLEHSIADPVAAQADFMVPADLAKVPVKSGSMRRNVLPAKGLGKSTEIPAANVRGREPLSLRLQRRVGNVMAAVHLLLRAVSVGGVVRFESLVKDAMEVEPTISPAEIPKGSLSLGRFVRLLCRILGFSIWSVGFSRTIDESLEAEKIEKFLVEIDL
ncbi:MAG: hypothetical protein N2255_00475 [Kiritimatiellae bacterium]|jgi:hypothetical protein|nr:hypothetical protein [Kiritimatiellia bacterium]